MAKDKHLKLKDFERLLKKLSRLRRKKKKKGMIPNEGELIKDEKGEGLLPPLIFDIMYL